MEHSEAEAESQFLKAESPQRSKAVSLSVYFVLTFLASWAVWLAAASIPSQTPSPRVLELLFLPGTFAPGIVAIWLTARAEGSSGVHQLLRQLARWNVAAGWYVFAAGYMAAIKLTAAGAHRVMTGEWPRFGEAPWFLMLAGIAFSTLFQAGEEIGWRGYALPRLAARMGLGRASLLLGVIWAAWHLPFFFVPGTDTVGQSFPVYLLAVTALSVAMAWLYAHTRGSLLLVMLMHAAVNNTTGIVPASSAAAVAANPFAISATVVGWLTVGLLWVVAAFFLVRMPSLRTG